MPLQRPRYLGFSKNQDLAVRKRTWDSLFLPSSETGVKGVWREES
jgi:hypothetical protein